MHVPGDKCSVQTCRDFHFLHFPPLLTVSSLCGDDMHPALIPEKHPMCGKYMEALVKCREDHRFSRYLGACNEHTYDLSRCLVIEKKEARADRQANYQEKWRKKRADDNARMQLLEEQAAAKAKAAEAEPLATSQHA